MKNPSTVSLEEPGASYIDPDFDLKPLKEMTEKELSILGLRPVKIALIGAAGTGKTTTALALAKQSERLKYVSLPTSKIMEDFHFENHYDVVEKSAGIGITFQEKLIRQRILFFNTLNENSYVTDRTALDSLVYYLVHNSFWAAESLSNYLEKRVREAMSIFNKIYLFPANSLTLKYNELRNLKPKYHEMTNYVFLGLLNKYKLKYKIVEEISLEKRVNFILETLEEDKTK